MIPIGSVHHEDYFVFCAYSSIYHMLEGFAAFAHLLDFLLHKSEVDAVVRIPAGHEAGATVANDRCI